MIKHAFIVTNAKGSEFRYERYAQSSSTHDAMRAEDSAIRAFIETFGVNPTSVREVTP